MNNPYSIKNCLFRGLALYAFLSIAFVSIMTMVTDFDNYSNAFMVALLEDLLFFFVYSLIFGFSFIVFKFKLPSSVCRTIHVLLVYVFTLIMYISVSGMEKADTIKQSFVVTIAYIFIYLISYGVSRLIKKIFG